MANASSVLENLSSCSGLCHCWMKDDARARRMADVAFRSQIYEIIRAGLLTREESLAHAASLSSALQDALLSWMVAKPEEEKSGTASPRILSLSSVWFFPQVSCFRVFYIGSDGCRSRSAFRVRDFRECDCSVSVLGSHSAYPSSKLESAFFLSGLQSQNHHLSVIIFTAMELITFRRIIKSKSTEDFSGVPYVSTLLNNLLSAWYGLPFVSPHNLLVSTINGTGAVIESVYVIIFLIYAPKKGKVKIMGLLALALTVFAAVVLVSLIPLHGQKRKIFCGFAATIFSICMYASPLSIMRLVIRTKSVEFMPFFLSLFVFLCGTSWFIYGLLGRDPFVAVSRDLFSPCNLLKYGFLSLSCPFFTQKGPRQAVADAIRLPGRRLRAPLVRLSIEVRFGRNLRKHPQQNMIVFHLIQTVHLMWSYPEYWNAWKGFQTDGSLVPNGFGCGLGTLQLILYAIYRDRKGGQKKGSGESEGKDAKAVDVEIGYSNPHQQMMNGEKPSGPANHANARA
ncbi:hypothetical protein ACLOJK_016736 [Asimina triloba]